MEVAVKAPTPAKTRRAAEHSSFRIKTVQKNMQTKHIISFICALCFALTPSYGEETPPPYVVLATGDHVNGRQDIYIPAGYLIEIISVDLATGTDQPGTPGQAITFSRLEIEKNGDPFNFNLCYTSERPPSAFPRFTGPALIRVMDQGGRNSRAIVGLEITEISSTNVIPTNTVVIPSDASGPVEIIIESSEDLVSWTPVNPGTYGSSTAKRFFRIRAVVSPK